jgi:two-component system, NarL family, sensor histidine kinase UhpB
MSPVRELRFLGVSEPPVATTAPGPLMSAHRSGREVEHGRRYLSLFRRVAGMNALLLVAAVVVTIVVLAPHRISSFVVDRELLVLVAALALVAFVNLYVLRRFIRPLQALSSLARRVDLANPGARMPSAEPTSETGELALTFNEMLDRLEAERREATGRVLAGQEAERLRIAQELHDQIGQELTAVLLVLSRLEARVAGELRPEVLEVQNDVRCSLEDLRAIAIELRPEALDDLGLLSALAVLGQRLGERSALQVVERVPPELPPLRPEIELVVYRIAQEALTNAARHSGTDHAELVLETEDRRLVLAVRDHGRGLARGYRPGTGMRGMRERATLVGGTVEFANGSPGTGCLIRLEIPLDAER